MSEPGSTTKRRLGGVGVFASSHFRTSEKPHHQGSRQKDVAAYHEKESTS